MTDSYAVDREQMVARQVESRGIHEPRILAALRRVPRHLFVDPAARHLSYSDRAFGIACDQTISQPYMVALMTAALDVQVKQRVLEVGTGSGYQAAVLAELGAEVFTIERHSLLASQAQVRLGALGYSRVHVLHGDGCLGWPAAAPFDRIVITAACAEVPAALWGQLSLDGLLVAPVGPSDVQALVRYRHQDQRWQPTELIDCRFVPLLAGLPREPCGSSSPP